MAVVDRWHLSDGTRSTDYGRGKRWMVRYRNPQGQQKSKSFDTKAAATAHDVNVRGAVIDATYVDPKAGRETFAQYAERWLALQTHWRPSTRRSQEQMVNLRMVPHIGLTPMGTINRSQVQALVNAWRQDYSPSTVTATFSSLRTILSAAVDDRVIARDPSAKVKVPTPPRRRDAHLSHADVALILGTAKPELRPFFSALAWCGLRLGEALGLDVADVDFLAGTVTVSKQMDTESPTGAIVPFTKTDAGRRTVPAPQVLTEMSSARLAARRRSDGSLEGRHLWTDPAGRRLLRTVVDSEVRRIERRTGLTFSPHHLRHYYGASLISAGVPVPQVAKQMGHASPQVTMRVYAYAMTDDAAKGRDAVSALAALSAPCAPDVHRTAVGGE
jgi:integrase